MNDAPAETGKPWNWQLFPFSSVKAGEDALYVASVGYGVYQINGEEQWLKLSAGMPQSAMVNRLQLQSSVLHACTSEGLYQYTNGQWVNDGLAIPCYQYRMLGGTGYAATDYGLWSNSGSRWEKSACADKRVYDFMNLPQYLVVGHESGVALYDRFMDEWAEFELGRAVTSLAVYRGHLIGVSDRGELMIGDKKGRFDRIRFSKQFIFSIVAKGKDIYVCTDKGLFQLAYIRNQVTLLSVKLGIPVTDVDLQGDSLYMATLFQGIQMMDA